ncbi:MAG: hypothetical protein WC325_11510, partial [Candidatus Bathyarchaeia archaeon]
MANSLPIDHYPNKVRKGIVGKETNEPLLNRVFQWLREHPNIKQQGKLRKLALDLGIDYQKNKAYLWKLSSRWKTDLRNERGSRLAVRSKPDGQHAVFAEVWVPECLERKRFVEVTGLAVEAGWVLSRNRNRILIWDRDRGSLGRVQWWETGRVFVHVKKRVSMDRVRTLLYHAFSSTGLIHDWGIIAHFV